MRGKPFPVSLSVQSARITPAGAGKTKSLHITNSRKRDHPRRCGENIRRCNSWLVLLGSPPQVRGKLKEFIQSYAYSGITPAGAGKTTFLHCITVLHWDHPRRCGENGLTVCDRLICRGSPPQVRGKPISRTAIIFCHRITPAGAGKTTSPVPLRRLKLDHPRRCGENWAMTGLLSALARITPAGAGKTIASDRNKSSSIGSPPQVRGKLY